ncbi:MAG TPA: hypothetical protein VGK16_05150 [Candidatus Limnocylindrales bacterium]
MSLQPVRILVLYSHALMGEGLGRMLANEPGVSVDAVDSASPDAVTAALAAEPSVIVVEEGGAVDAAEIMRRSSCPLVLDVDITTTRAWTLRRESLSSRPDDFLAAIRQVVGGLSREPADGEAAAERDRRLQQVQVPG